jgi:hypothetical protein
MVESTIFCASMGSTAMGGSITFCASKGSTTMGGSVTFCASMGYTAMGISINLVPRLFPLVEERAWEWSGLVT